MHVRVAIIAAITASIRIVASVAEVEFFYTDTIDLCQLKGAAIPANEQTTHGGVCAYRADVANVYGCPAPDETCWTSADRCNSNTAGQTVCNRENTVWCCNAVAGDTCTTTEGQINVCISNFTSPNAGVSIAQAQSVYLSVLGVSNVTATSQSLDPTPFSTRTLAVSTISAGSSSTTSSQSTTQTGSSTSATTSVIISATSTSVSSGTAVPASDSSSSSNSSGISGGAIAGIVIGAIVVLAIIAAAWFLISRRRKRNDVVRSDKSAQELSPDSSPINADSNEKRHQIDSNGMSELSSNGHGRAEMSAVATYDPPPMRHEIA